MKPLVEVVVATHRRPDNIPKMRCALRKQTIPLTLTLVDATEGKWWFKPSTRGFDRVHVTRNIGAWHRLGMCGLYDHHYTWIIDDDLMPPPHALNQLVDFAQGVGDWFSVLGFHGRSLTGNGIEIIDNVESAREVQWLARSYFVKTADMPWAIKLRHDIGRGESDEYRQIDYLLCAGVSNATGCANFVLPKVEKEWTALPETGAVSRQPDYLASLMECIDAVNRVQAERNYSAMVNYPNTNPHTAERLILEIMGDGDLYPWASSRESSDFIAALMRMAGAKTALELGTWRGLSTIKMAEAVGDGGLVVTVDNKDNTKGRLARYEHADRIRHYICDSRRPITDTRAFDFVFMDSGHEHRDTVQEIEAHWQHIMPNALIVFDDSLSHHGVRSAISEMEHRGMIQSFTLPTPIKEGVPTPNGITVAKKIM